jgi:hypothetical protein
MQQPNATSTKTTKTKTTTRSTTELRATLVLIATLVLPAACGGGASSQVEEPTVPRHTGRIERRDGAPQAVPVRPILVRVNPKRSGGSLEVGIEVVGRGHGEGEAFEDTAGWTIVALDHRGQELRRIMNGPGHLERAPVGMEDGSQWDVTVKGTVFFALPKDVQHVAVRVAVPQAQPVEIQSEVR